MNEDMKNAAARHLVQVLLAVAAVLFLSSAGVSAEDDFARIVEKKRQEFAKKEETLKKEEERINSLRKDFEERAGKYSELLVRVEDIMKKIGAETDERLQHMVKAYETMAPEDAAARISAMDEKTAVKILIRMKSKKVGTLMAFMEPAKAVSLTKSITGTEKKIPAR